MTHGPATVTPLGARLLYANCWEDLAVARRALRIPTGGLVVTIGSAGDNAIGLLLDDPRRILAVDLNPAQTALVELKLAAVRSMPGDVAGFTGALSDFVAPNQRLVGGATGHALRGTLQGPFTLPLGALNSPIPCSAIASFNAAAVSLVSELGLCSGSP